MASFLNFLDFGHILNWLTMEFRMEYRWIHSVYPLAFCHFAQIAMMHFICWACFELVDTTERIYIFGVVSSWLTWWRTVSNPWFACHGLWLYAIGQMSFGVVLHRQLISMMFLRLLSTIRRWCWHGASLRNEAHLQNWSLTKVPEHGPGNTAYLCIIMVLHPVHNPHSTADLLDASLSQCLLPPLYLLPTA